MKKALSSLSHVVLLFLVAAARCTVNLKPQYAIYNLPVSPHYHRPEPPQLPATAQRIRL